MIDASREFLKDGNKNRLRERVIHCIVGVFTRLTEVPGYARPGAARQDRASGGAAGAEDVDVLRRDDDSH